MAIKKLTLGKPPGKPPARPADIEIFTGGDVRLRELVTEADAELIRSGVVRFSAGGRTRWHHHEADQLLIVIEGHGIVEDEEVRHDVRAGDVVFIPRGVRHWHGSDGETELTHISVLTPGDEVIDE
jgi:quercetin dioxygenase-like cupin family protein